MRESATGRTAIATGAGRGIGRFIAGSFVQAGYRIVINDIDQKQLERVRAKLAADGAEVMSVLADVRDEADVRRLMGAAQGTSSTSGAGIDASRCTIPTASVAARTS
jgi:NAD(P)-dependent dehydrogenase (short-subunit alcohol dehydrogenase family)